MPRARNPGRFFRREIGRPSEEGNSDLPPIDRRPIRRGFFLPKNTCYETSGGRTVLSVDMENEPDVVALPGASTTLHISPVPF